MTHYESPQKVYQDLMKTVFAPALRRAGLKGSAGRFELPSAICWAQLGFQKSAHSDSQSVRFTVNLSVIDRAQWDAAILERPYYGKRPTPTVLYGQIQESVRLGQLVTGGDDLWWHIHRGLDAASVGQVVRGALVDLGIPWLVSRVKGKD